MPPDPKKAPRIRDHMAVRTGLLRYPWCAACGRAAGSAHHVVPRGEGGDDVVGNIIGLCGSGTTGCHGAWHGNPYEAAGVRRDAEWVRRHAGADILERRSDVIEYVIGKLGEVAGWDYLDRIYYINLSPASESPRPQTALEPPRT